MRATDKNEKCALKETVIHEVLERHTRVWGKGEGEGSWWGRPLTGGCCGGESAGRGRGSVPRQWSSANSDGGYARLSIPSANGDGGGENTHTLNVCVLQGEQIRKMRSVTIFRRYFIDLSHKDANVGILSVDLVSLRALLL